MTVSTTTKTYDQLLTEIETKKYDNAHAAATLVYWDNKDTLGLRVEAPSIMKEFVDNVAFGRGAFIQIGRICGFVDLWIGAHRLLRSRGNAVL